MFVAKFGFSKQIRVKPWVLLVRHIVLLILLLISVMKIKSSCQSILDLKSRGGTMNAQLGLQCVFAPGFTILYTHHELGKWIICARCTLLKMIHLIVRNQLHLLSWPKGNSLDPPSHIVSISTSSLVLSVCTSYVVQKLSLNKKGGIF